MKNELMTRRSSKTDPKNPGQLDPRRSAMIWYLVLMLLFLWFWQDALNQFAVRTIPYSQFKTYLVNHQVTEASVKQDEIVGRIVPRTPAPTNALTAIITPPPANRQPVGTNSISAAEEPFHFKTIRLEDPDLVKELQAAGAQYAGVRLSFLSQFLLGWGLPIAAMFGLWMFLGRQFRTAGQSIFSFGRSAAKLNADKTTGVTFQDVAGCDEAKVELREVVDFLKNPKHYQELGAKIPKGVLLVGPPGTGKTLLARAVAGEAQVPFFSLNGSDFVEMFVGVGAARVRDLFQQAKQQAPCIIFIDELDAIGRERSVHLGAINDEREQTLNQLLAEMDGFEPNAGVIMLAATNRPEVLDRALLRPGRFDRQIVVDAPDLDGRQAILKVHAKDKPLAAGVDLRQVAQATAGFSGADLANALNEAALLAARRQEREITQTDLEDAIEKVVAGPERKSRRINDEQKRRVACHEVGHALVAAFTPTSDPVRKITIIPHGHAALGYTLQLPTDDQFLLSRTELLAHIRGMLGGRAAEEVEYGEATTGAQNDLEHATALARQMVCLFGMSDSVGLANCAQRPPVFLEGQDFQLQRDCSEQTAREIDVAVKKILDQAYAEAKEILTTHRQQLRQVVAELLKRETLDGQVFYQLVGQPLPHPPDAFPQSVAPSRAPAPDAAIK
jgi:cell division protease FtsH